MSVIICPVCYRQHGADGPGEPLVQHHGGFDCAQGHHFDRAKQGYVNVMVGRHVHRGDTAAMVDARLRAHTSAFFDPVHRWLKAHSVGQILDLGGGPGVYLQHLLAQGYTPGAGHVLLDASTPALKRAAKVAGVTALGADLLAPLPLADQGIDTVWSVFAPRPLAQIRRVLKPGGRFLCVLPSPTHLQALRDQLPAMLAIGEDKTNRLIEEAQGVGLAVVTREPITKAQVLTPAQQVDLVAMGPSAFHLDLSNIAQGVGQEDREVTLACTALVFQAPQEG